MNFFKLSAALVLLLFANTARALVIDVNVTVDPTFSVQAGGTGLLPVFISSNNSSELASFNFQFLIQQAGVTTTQLAFDTASLDPSSTASTQTLTDPKYVFVGQSSDQGVFSQFSNITNTSYVNDTISGGDAITSGFVTLPSSTTSTLLTYLPLTTATGAPPSAGDSFTVSLVPSGATSGLSGLNSTFQDSSNNYFTFGSSPGTVTITAAPEPASWVMAVMALAGLSGYGAFRRRQRTRLALAAAAC